MQKQDPTAVPAYPRAVNHVGVGVADIERAIRWYKEVLGFTLLKGPFEVHGADPGSDVQDVLGQDCNALLLAHMVSVNGIGIELFQLLDPPHERRDPPLEYWKSGFFHICVTDPDIEGLAGRIALSGGRQRSKIWRNTHNYETLYGGMKKGQKPETK